MDLVDYISVTHDFYILVFFWLTFFVPLIFLARGNITSTDAHFFLRYTFFVLIYMQQGGRHNDLGDQEKEGEGEKGNHVMRRKI